jgi:hypothetical protein
MYVLSFKLDKEFYKEEGCQDVHADGYFLVLAAK